MHQYQRVLHIFLNKALIFCREFDDLIYGNDMKKGLIGKITEILLSKIKHKNRYKDAKSQYSINAETHTCLMKKTISDGNIIITDASQIKKIVA
jgi:hypothetical protein